MYFKTHQINHFITVLHIIWWNLRK